MDGVFVACINFSEPELLELADAGTPMVTIDHTYPGHPSVYSDNADGIRKAVRYAHEKGHTRIAFISGAPAGVTNKRFEGYESTLKELGIPVREEYYKVSRYHILCSPRNRQGGYSLSLFWRHCLVECLNLLSPFVRLEQKSKGSSRVITLGV